MVSQRERGRDTGRGRSRTMHREPDVGLDPGSPGSRPGPKAGAKLLRHAGIPFGRINKIDKPLASLIKKKKDSNY